MKRYSSPLESEWSFRNVLTGRLGPRVFWEFQIQ